MRTARRYPNMPLARFVRFGWLGFCLLLLTACHQDMYVQPKYQPLDASDFFADGRSARQPVEGAVAVDEIRTDEYFFTGIVDGQEVDAMPFPVTREVLDRGREQYDIYCAACHGITGQGRGMVAQRGGIVPANLHDQRLRDAPIGHFYNVITNGYRYMYPYDSHVEPADRWAIAAYIRALQLSQNATLDDVPPAQRNNLEVSN
ncbi:MAG: cytochrome c [Chloroflexales bacterium]|nr:cytochrome c [Chloroflexales bacterium]